MGLRCYFCTDKSTSTSSKYMLQRTHALVDEDQPVAYKGLMVEPSTRGHIHPLGINEDTMTDNASENSVGWPHLL